MIQYSYARNKPGEKRWFIPKFIIALSFTCSLLAQTQPATVNLNESSTIVANPLRIGLNNSTVTNYDSGQYCKNWFCTNNPSFQGTIAEQTIPIVSGTKTTFVGQNVYDLAPVGIWAGASWHGLASPSSSGFNNESGTISTNTANNCPACTVGPTYTMSAAIANAPAKGDYAAIKQEIDYTTGTLCGVSGQTYSQLTCTQGWNQSAISGGATVGTQSSDLPPSTYDLQTLLINTTASGSSVDLIQYPDNPYTGKAGNYAVMWNGTSFTISIKCKAISGTVPATITFSVQRLASGEPNHQGTGSCTSSWSTVSYTFTGTETTSTGMAVIKAQIEFPQGTVFEVTDSYLGQTTYTNPTIYNDAYVSALKVYGGDSLRLWDSGVGDSFDDMITPAWGRHFSFWAQGTTYFNAANTVASGYYDHLFLCQTLSVKVCSMVVPATWNLTDYEHLIEFMAGTTGTYSSKRNALDALYGRANGPFTSSIPEIIIEFTDEPWNTVFSGENMPNIGDGYAQTAYGLWASQVFSAIKSDSAYTSSVKLAINCQSVTDDACQSDTYGVLKNAPNTDVVMLSNYFGYGNDLDTITNINDEFDPQSGFAYSNANDSTNGWVKVWANGMASHSYPQTLAIYEGGPNTNGGTVTTSQLAAHTSAMINGAQIVQGYMETMKELGITIQNVWQSNQDFYSSGGANIPAWGVFKDAVGGQLAGQGGHYFRQIALGVQIANQCIGSGSTMYGATLSGETTYSTSAMNGQPAWSNLPYLTAYAFETGENRCILFANTNPNNPATVSITGTNAPTTVTENLLLGNSITANNESATPGVTIQTITGVSVTPTLTIPAYSVAAVSWTVSPTVTSISNVQATAVTETSATITWTTNNSASSLVSYGTSLSYGSSSPLNSTLVTSHSVILTGLTPGTLYDYTVNSTAGTGVQVASANYSFTTVTPPAISNVQVSGITTTGATITWTTNTPTTAQALYGTTTAYGSSVAASSTPATSFSVTLSGLTSGTPYDFKITATDATGDQVASSNYSFTTSTSLVLSNVQASAMTTSGATVTWTTSVATTSQVAYGTSTAYGSSTSVNSTMVTSHSVALAGLSAGTVYDFKAQSTDASGDQLVSSNYSFTTAAIPVISNVQVSGISSNGAIVTWTTNTPTSSRVVYATTAAYATPLNASLVTAHSVTLSGLTAGTKYSYLVQSVDAFGNQVTSAASIFTTSASPTPAAPSVTASGSGGTGQSVTSITTGTGGASFSCGSGNAAVAFISLASPAAVTVSDSAGNGGWTSYGSQSGLSNSGYGQWFYNPRLTTSVTSVTASWASAQGWPGIIVHCVSGLAASPADFNAVSSSNAWSASVAGGSFTTTASSEIVFFGVSNGNGTTFAPGAGWTLGLNENTGGSLATAYQVFPSPQTTSATGTLSSTSSQETLTIGFKFASSVAATPSVTASGSGGTGQTVTSISTGTGGSSFNCPAGSGAVAFVSLASSASVTVSDSAGNSGWTSYGSQNGLSNSGYGQWFYNPRLAASVTSVTASWSPGQGYPGIIAHCISGLTASPADFSAADSSSSYSTSVTGGTFTTTTAPEIVFLGVTNGGGATFSPASAWTLGLNENSGGALATAYQILSSSQTGAASGALSSSSAQETITIGLK